MKVLVVDDEELIPRLFLQRFRRETGSSLVEFVFAASGEEALGVFEGAQTPFDFILSDINMPGMNGLELVEELQKRRCTTPIYFVSAYDSDEIRTATEELGVEGFFSKPLDFQKLRILFRLEG